MALYPPVFAPSPGITIVESGGGTTVSEDGTTDTFTVALDVAPASDVIVNVSSDDATELSVDRSSLTFTAANWNVPQSVTVTGVDDALTDGDVNSSVTLSVDFANSDPAYGAVANVSTPVLVEDNEYMPTHPRYVRIERANGALAIAEVMVMHNGENVAVGGTATQSTTYGSAGAHLAIDGNTNGNLPAGSVTGTLNEANPWWELQLDADTEIDEIVVWERTDFSGQLSNFTIRLLGSDRSVLWEQAGNPEPSPSLALTPRYIPGITVAEAGGTTVIGENGLSDSFSVVLDSKPTADVHLSLTASDVGALSLTPSSLTFSAATWNVPQQVTIDAGLLADGVNLAEVTVAIETSSSAPEYANVPGELINQTIEVVTVDADSIGSGDFNGDGVADLFRHSGAEITVGINAGDALASQAWPVVDPLTGETVPFPSALWADAETATIGDFSGDGRDDLLHVQPTLQTWSLARSGDASFDYWELPVQGLTPSGPLSLALRPVVGDFNGDGRDDVAVFEVASGAWLVGESLGTSFRLTNWATDGSLPVVEYAVAADVNGDGREDLVAHENTGTVTVWLSDGTRFVGETWATLSPPNPNAPIQLGDINGDGKSDLVAFDSSVATYRIGIASDHGFDSNQWSDLSGFTADASLVDVNGDGIADLVGKDPLGEWIVGLAGNGQFSSQTWQLEDSTDWFVELSLPGSQARTVVDYGYRSREVFARLEQIQTTVDFAPSAGVIRGGALTESSGAGNAFDQAALLADSIGDVVDMRFVTGRLSAADQNLARLTNWLGVNSVDEAVAVLDAANLNPVVTVGEAVEFDHAWLQARLPSTTGLDWVDLDPSWKQYVGADTSKLQLDPLDPFWTPTSDTFGGSVVSFSDDFNGAVDYGAIPSSLSTTNGAVKTVGGKLLFQEQSAIFFNQSDGLNGTISVGVSKVQPGVQLFGRATKGSEYGLRFRVDTVVEGDFIHFDTKYVHGYGGGTANKTIRVGGGFEYQTFQRPILVADLYRREGTSVTVLASTEVPNAFDESSETTQVTVNYPFGIFSTTEVPPSWQRQYDDLVRQKFDVLRQISDLEFSARRTQDDIFSVTLQIGSASTASQISQLTALKQQLENQFDEINDFLSRAHTALFNLNSLISEMDAQRTTNPFLVRTETRTTTVEANYPAWEPAFDPSHISLSVDGDTITASVGTAVLTATNTSHHRAGLFGFANVAGEAADDLDISLEVAGQSIPSTALFSRHYQDPNAVPLGSRQIQQAVG
ncbi:MAG: FG-GAP-like repeat-containing protein, partial [Pirellulales bacterium]|nr:FG-GAP-like repeat-containing protein [Pirellulales bacterium]